MTSSTITPSKSSDGIPTGASETGATIHPLSAALLIAADGLWTLIDWAAVAWIVTVPLSFLAVCRPVYLIQTHLQGADRGKSMVIASLSGVLAAIPTPITGTIVGGDCACNGRYSVTTENPAAVEAVLTL